MFRKKKSNVKKLLVTRGSRKIYLPLYALVIVLLFVLLWIIYKDLPVSVLALILLGIFIFAIIKYTELHRLSRYYEINKNALLHGSGLINKKFKNIDFFAISNVDYEQTAWQRLLNYGDVNVSLFSEMTTIKSLNNPARFVEVLEKAILDKRIGVTKYGTKGA